MLIIAHVYMGKLFVKQIQNYLKYRVELFTSLRDTQCVQHEIFSVTLL